MKTEYKELKISRETAERWYNGDDVELKGLALTAFPDLEQIKPVVGEWYWTKSNRLLFRVRDIDGDRVSHYPYYFWEGNLNNHEGFESISNIDSIATEQEIFEAFDKEARKIGCYEKRYKNLENNLVNRHGDFCCLFCKSTNIFWLKCGLVWHDGKWAEFVDDFKEGETLAFSDYDGFDRFYVIPYKGKTEDGRFIDVFDQQWNYAKRIEYKLL